MPHSRSLDLNEKIRVAGRVAKQLLVCIIRGAVSPRPITEERQMTMETDGIPAEATQRNCLGGLDGPRGDSGDGRGAGSTP